MAARIKARRPLSQFGEVFGRIMALAEAAAPFVDGPAPSVWKLREKVPLDPEAIVKKAETEFPGFAHMFYGPKGGPLHDRAEAAFLARYAARKVVAAASPHRYCSGGT